MGQVVDSVARWPILLGLLLILAGCGPDPAELAQCRRMIAAFEDEPGRIAVVRAVRDPERRHGVVIHYRIVDEPAERWIACRFRARRFESAPLEPVRVATDREGELSERRLFFLRLWLDLERSVPVPQRAPDAAAERPPSNPAGEFALYLAQQTINGAVLGCVYGLLAVGYSLVYAILGRINFAFGELHMIGAYHTVIAAILFTLLGAEAAAALPAILAAVVLTTALHGWAMERLVFRPMRAASSHGVLIAAIGLTIFLQESVRLLQGARDRWLPPLAGEPVRVAEAGAFALHVSPGQLLVLGVTAVAGGGLLAVLRWTGFGRALRACADDMRMAALLGVDVNRTVGLTFALGAGCAAAAGMIVATHYGGVNFFMGFLIGFKALAAAIVGGIGSVPGAFLGGVLIAMLETGWSALFPLGYKDIAVFAALILFLILRPNGILGVERMRGD